MNIEGAAILVVALLVDVILGEPIRNPWLSIHPTVIIGRFIKLLDRRTGIKVIDRIYGFLIVIIVISPVLFLLSLFEELLSQIPLFALRVVLLGFFLKFAISIRFLFQKVLEVADSMKLCRRPEAEESLRFLVRRDPRELTDEQLISAAIESLAESLVDGITSPLLYYSLIGLRGAFIQRVVNTLDSMIGYKDEKHKDIGFLSAKLDTIINFIPSRLTALLIIAAAIVLGYEWKNGIRILLRDHGKTESLNAGWPMAAMAGVLRIQLEKPGFYKLGDPLEPLTFTHIKKAIKIASLSLLFYLLIITSCILLINL